MYEVYQWSIGAAHFLIFVYLALGARRLTREFPSLYLFVAWNLFQHVSQVLVAAVAPDGIGSDSYFHYYYTTGIVNFGLQCYLLVEIWRSLEAKWSWKFTLSAIGASALFLYHFTVVPFSQGGYFYLVTIAVLVHCQAYFCLVTHLTLALDRGIHLDPLRKGVFGALSLTAVFYYLTFSAQVLGYLPYEILSMLVQPASLAAWLVIAYSSRRQPVPALQSQGVLVR